MLKEQEKFYSLRRVAQKIGLEPAYLSKVERGLVAPPSEAKIVALAHVLDEDPDFLLALAGKVLYQRRTAIMQEFIRLAASKRNFNLEDAFQGKTFGEIDNEWANEKDVKFKIQTHKKNPNSIYLDVKGWFTLEDFKTTFLSTVLSAFERQKGSKLNDIT